MSTLNNDASKSQEKLGSLGEPSTEILVELWRQSRSTIDHMDDKMNDLRLAVYTLFGTLTSVAAALMFWAPQVFLGPVRLSALVEYALIIVLVPLIVQNRLYHLWLFQSIVVTMNLEDLLHKALGTASAPKEKSQIFLTYGFIHLNQPPQKYWPTMLKSLLFWSDIVMFAAPLIAAVVLALAFQAGPMVPVK